ncbi:excisionase family DNA-binding protein [Mycolicibacterium sp. PAM1]|uniref:excisionase family DNA-binding protein n=1 Tax=Mycolicibacterium sp. PAM1 TaxID=2853535 RepID=UPI001C3C6C52|nr:excisionase family DNA-binding protein [Mycolicibacterium sp. PAM1]MBV5243900.1 excisionase family DNA-binding protein [Mycolicibacterium sp. PAM1]
MSAPRTTREVLSQRRRYATQAEAAEYLGVTTRTIRQMIADGRLTGYRLNPRFIRIDLNEVDAAMTPIGGGVAR